MKTQYFTVMKAQYFITSLLCISYSVWAEPLETDRNKVFERLNEQRNYVEIEGDSFHVKKPRMEIKIESTKNINENKAIEISVGELKQHPDWIIEALQLALLENNTEKVRFFYPFYQELDNTLTNPILLKWSEAIIARSENDYNQAIALYRDVLAIDSDIPMLRLQLALSLFHNNELEAAQDQFRKLESLPFGEDLKQIIANYQQAILEKEQWSFSGGITYVREPNVNNAPKSGTTYHGNWHAPEPESAERINMRFNVDKKWFWYNNFFSEFYLDAYGKYYWDNKKYNEYSFRPSLGIGFQNNQYSVSLSPFINYILYAGGASSQTATVKRFSQDTGITFEWSKILSAKWKVDGVFEFAKQKYVERKHLNGDNQWAQVGLTYLVSPTQYWNIGIDVSQTHTRYKDDSFIRKSARLGWGQEWGKGISSYLVLNYGHRSYKDKMPIFGIVQRNKEYGMQVSLWHRAIHYKGITPRVSYYFNKVKSNHPFYSYNKHRVYLDFSKRF